MPFLPNIGPVELILILIIALVVFGPGKLPDVANSLGKSVREFRRAASDITEATKVDPETPATNQPAAAPAPNALADSSAPNQLAEAPAPKPASTDADGDKSAS